MVSIVKRPLDLLIVLFLFFFLLIALTIDLTQSLYGSILSQKDVKEGVWPPSQVLQTYAWWCENYDPLTAKNPAWYESMAWFSPVLYAPFYAFAIYAFMLEKEWIRVPALMWGYGLLLCMFVIVREQLWGEHAAPEPLMFWMAYSAYIFMPLLVMLRVAWTPVFKPATKSHSE